MHILALEPLLLSEMTIRDLHLDRQGEKIADDAPAEAA